MNITGAIFSQIRKAANLTQREMSTLLEMSQSHISEIEKGIRSVPKNIHYVLIDKLNVNRQWLETGEGSMFNEKDEPTPEPVISSDEGPLTRIRDVISELGITNFDFAQRMDMTYRYLTMIFSKEKPLTESVIRKLVETYGINREWLLTGEGEMFVKNSKDYALNPEISVIHEVGEQYSPQKRSSTAQTTVIDEPPNPKYHEGKLLKEYLERFYPESINDFALKTGIPRPTVYNTIFYYERIEGQYRAKIEDALGESIPDIMNRIVDYLADEKRRMRYLDRMGHIPLFNIDAQAGGAAMFMNDSPEYIQDYFDIPIFKDCLGYITVWGNSMSPKYNAGEIIAIKEIKNKSIVPYGEAYLIVTQEQRIIKYVFPGQNREEWSLVSENEKYPPFPVMIKDVINIYLVKGRITKDAM